jgi:hypothetical protein
MSVKSLKPGSASSLGITMLSDETGICAKLTEAHKTPEHSQSNCLPAAAREKLNIDTPKQMIFLIFLIFCGSY